MDEIEPLISDLYRSAVNTPVSHFRERCLRSLHSYIQFDGALWASGSFESKRFHAVTLLELSKDFPAKLLSTQDSNPIVQHLYQNPGKAIDMADIVDDEDFYHSDIYRHCFAPHGIQRILSSGHLQERSGIFTILSLYRFNREERFNENEKRIQNRVLFHLLSAASLCYFINLKQQLINSQHGAALCDQEGFIYEAEPLFLDILDEYYPQRNAGRLPFDLNTTENLLLGHHLTPMGDMVCVEIWPRGPLDRLTQREKEIVDGVCSGQTFKEIAKQLQLSPSTVSNHLYRIYNKLEINSRSELVKLAS